MKRFGIGVLCGIAGYLTGAFAGYVLLGQFSSNAHDRAVEAATTGAFVIGPLAGLAAFIVGLVRAGRAVAVPTSPP